MALTLIPAARADSTAAGPGADLGKLVGQPADIAPGAYPYRCDRPAANPPESDFLFSALRHNKAAVLCGLLWEEPRPVKQVVLSWPAGAKAVLKPDQIVLRWFPEGSSSSWWRRAGEGATLHEAAKPAVSADGRVLSYTLDALSNDKAIDNLVVAVKDGAAAGSFDVPTVEVLAPQTWKPADLVVEWGFQEGTEQLPFDGSVEIYNGVLGKVAPLVGDQGTRMTGAAGWESRAVGTAAGGLDGPDLYVGYTDTPVWPGQAKIEDVNRTIVTVATRSGSFSFLPGDLTRADPGPRVRLLRGQGRRRDDCRGLSQRTGGQGTQDAAATDPAPARANLAGRHAGGPHGSERRLSPLSAAQGDGADAGGPAGAVSQRRLEARCHQHAARRDQGRPRQMVFPRPALRSPGPRNEHLPAGAGPDRSAPRGPRRLRNVARSGREARAHAGRLVDGRSGAVFLGHRVGNAHGGGISLIHIRMLEHYL